MSIKRPASPLPEECRKKIPFPTLLSFLLVKELKFLQYEAMKEKMENLVVLTADQEMLNIWKKVVDFLDDYKISHRHVHRNWTTLY